MEYEQENVRCIEWASGVFLSFYIIKARPVVPINKIRQGVFLTLKYFDCLILVYKEKCVRTYKMTSFIFESRDKTT